MHYNLFRICSLNYTSILKLSILITIWPTSHHFSSLASYFKILNYAAFHVFVIHLSPTVLQFTFRRLRLSEIETWSGFRVHTSVIVIHITHNAGDSPATQFPLQSFFPYFTFLSWSTYISHCMSLCYGSNVLRNWKNRCIFVTQIWGNSKSKFNYFMSVLHTMLSTHSL